MKSIQKENNLIIKIGETRTGSQSFKEGDDDLEMKTSPLKRVILFFLNYNNYYVEKNRNARWRYAN